MRKFLKYFLPVVIIICTIFVLKTNNSFAASTYYNGFKYSITNKKVIITDYTSSKRDVIIPSKIKGYPVTRIHFECFTGKNIKTVKIPNSVTEIGDFAFDGCKSLTSVIMSNSIDYIGGQAFSGCINLKSIIIPNKVTYIGPFAFSGCTNLKSITIPESVTEISSCVFSNTSKLNSIYVYKNTYAYRKLKSEYSSKVKVIQLPSTPKVSLKSGSKKITIKWSALSQANGYQIYRSTSKTGAYSLLKTISNSSSSICINTGLKTGKIYYYKVRAYKVYAGVKVYGSFCKVVASKVK